MGVASLGLGALPSKNCKRTQVPRLILLAKEAMLAVEFPERLNKSPLQRNSSTRSRKKPKRKKKRLKLSALKRKKMLLRQRRPVPRTPSSWVSTATPQALAGEIAATLRASDPVQFCEAYDVLVYCTAWTHF